MSLLQPAIHRQGDTDTQDQVHHAGYDSFICGTVFLRICHFVHSKKFNSMEIMPFSFNSYLPSMSAYCNCVNVIRAALTFIKLDGTDPLSLRPPVLFVKSSLHTRLDISTLAAMLSSYGTVDIQLLNSAEALVATTNFVTAREIIFAFKHSKAYSVTNYNFWKHSSLGKGVWWGSVVIASGSFALILTNLLKKL